MSQQDDGNGEGGGAIGFGVLQQREKYVQVHRRGCSNRNTIETVRLLFGIWAPILQLTGFEFRNICVNVVQRSVQFGEQTQPGT